MASSSSLENILNKLYLFTNAFATLVWLFQAFWHIVELHVSRYSGHTTDLQIIVYLNDIYINQAKKNTEKNSKFNGIQSQKYVQQWKIVCQSVFDRKKNDQDFLETIKACSGNEFCFWTIFFFLITIHFPRENVLFSLLYGKISFF